MPVLIWRMGLCVFLGEKVGASAGRNVSEPGQCLYKYINYVSLDLKSRGKIQQNRLFIQLQNTPRAMGSHLETWARTADRSAMQTAQNLTVYAIASEKIPLWQASINPSLGQAGQESLAFMYFCKGLNYLIYIVLFLYFNVVHFTLMMVLLLQQSIC